MHSCLIVAPCASGKIAADDHLHAEAFTFQTYGHHRVRSGKFPVGYDVGSRIKKFCRNLVEHLSLVRDTLGEDNVKCRDAVGCDHHHEVIIDVVDVTNFSVVHAFLSRKVEICVGESFSHCCNYD